jgi:hypothetical protein
MLFVNREHQRTICTTAGAGFGDAWNWSGSSCLLAIRCRLETFWPWPDSTSTRSLAESLFREAPGIAPTLLTLAADQRCKRRLSSPVWRLLAKSLEAALARPSRLLGAFA